MAGIQARRLEVLRWTEVCNVGRIPRRIPPRNNGSTGAPSGERNVADVPWLAVILLWCISGVPRWNAAPNGSATAASAPASFTAPLIV